MSLNPWNLFIYFSSLPILLKFFPYDLWPRNYTLISSDFLNLLCCCRPICDRDVPPGASAFSHTELCDAVGERSPRCARLCLCAGPAPARAWAASFTCSLRRSLLSRHHPDATHHTLLARVMVSPQVAGVRIMAGRLFTRLDFLEWF